MPTRKRSASSPDVKGQIRAYLDRQPPATRKALQQIRATVHAAAPDATEVFSYGIPGFRREGKAFLWYAGWTAHVSLYPIGAAIRRAHAAAIKGLVTSTGTVRFPLERPLPLALVRRLAKARMAEMRAAARK